MGRSSGGMRTVGAGLVLAAAVAVAVVVPARTPPASAAAASVAPFRSADVFVRQQFSDFLAASPGAGDVAPYVAALGAATTDATATIDAIAHRAGGADRTGNVTRLYTAYFLRLPDFGGLSYWLGKARSGWTLNRISSSFAGSSEFTRRYGALADAAFVDLVYQNVLGRPPDPSGRAHWIAKLAGGTSRGVVMVSFSQSSEYQRRQAATCEVVLAYAGLLHRLPVGTEASDATSVVASGGFVALAGGLFGSAEYQARFPAPATPTALVAHPGDAKVTLTWKPPAPSAATVAGYAVRVLEGGVPVGSDRVVSAGATRTDVTGLVNGHTYSFLLHAYTASRDGADVAAGPVVATPEVVWSTFGGSPAHDGVQPRGTIPASPTLKWQTHFSGPVQQAVVGDGRIFVVTEGIHTGSATDGSSIYALDPGDGSVLWGPTVIDGHSYGKAYLGYDSFRLIAETDNGSIYGIDTTTGAIEWTRSLDFQIGESRGVTVSGGTVYAFGTGLMAIDAATGATRWHVSTQGTDGAIGVDSTGVYVVQNVEYAYRFTKAGAKVWGTVGPASGGGSGVAVLAAGRMWEGGDRLVTRTIRKQSDGTSLGAPMGKEPPAVSGSTVVYDDAGMLRGVDWASGTVLWSKSGDGHQAGSPVINAGRVYIRSAAAWVFSYSLANGTPAWSHDVQADLVPQPVNTNVDPHDLALGGGLVLVPLSIGAEQEGDHPTGALVAYG